MPNSRRDILNIELESGTINRSFVFHALGEGDIKGNIFGVRLFRNGEAVEIGGATCMGYFIRTDREETVVINGGTFSGNEAWVELPESCYTKTGAFSLVIKLVGGGVTGTMRIVDGAVVDSLVGDLIDPGNLIPSLQSLMSAVERAEAAADVIGGISIRAELVSGNNYMAVISKE